MKIGQYLTKLCEEYLGLLILAHPVCCEPKCIKIRYNWRRHIDGSFLFFFLGGGDPAYSTSLSVYGAVWHIGARRGNELELEDEDAVTEQVDGWKRINTLAHYNVQDGSTIHLVYDKQRTNSAADEEPHVVVNAHGTSPQI